MKMQGETSGNGLSEGGSKRRGQFWVDPKLPLWCRRFWLHIPAVKIAFRKLFAPPSLAPFLLFSILFVNPLFAKAPKSDWDYYQQYGHKSPKWDALVEAGFDTFESGNTNTALNFFKRAITLGSNDGLILFRLAQIVESGGNLKGALEMFEKGAPLFKEQYKNHPEVKEIPEHLGRLYYQLEKYDKALEKFLESIEQQGENFLRLYLVGQIFRMGGKPIEAISFFERALQYEVPKESLGKMKQAAQIELMRAYYDTQNLEKALGVANQILEEDPANPTAISTRDKIRQQGFKKKERETIKKLLERY